MNCLEIKDIHVHLQAIFFSTFRIFVQLETLVRTPGAGGCGDGLYTKVGPKHEGVMSLQ